MVQTEAQEGLDGEREVLGVDSSLVRRDGTSRVSGNSCYNG